MWKFLTRPFVMGYEFFVGGAAKAARMQAQNAARKAGATGILITNAGNLAESVARTNINKWTGRVLVGLTTGLAAIGGAVGFGSMIKMDETATKVGEFVGGTATEGKNVLLGLTMIAGLTAIGVVAFIVIKRK